MTIREDIQAWEQKNLSENATLSTSSRGRKKKETPCHLRTCFKRDTDKILQSLGFRLLKHKTQVFLSTSGEQFRTRFTHTLEVANIGRFIAKILGLNQDLVEAISLGHDLGHTPFGHGGEEVLNELTPFKFRHSEQSVRVVELIENSGCGLNLTYEVIDGIMMHSKGTTSIADFDRGGASRASTIEGEIVQFSDWFAYINHDIDDAFNMGLITKDDLPSDHIKVLGYNFNMRLVTMLSDVITQSRGEAHISMSPEILNATDGLRKFLYENVYNLPQLQEREKNASSIIGTLYDYYVNNYELVTDQMPFLSEEDPMRGACDFIAFLTDIQAQELFRYHALKFKRKIF